VNLDKTNVVLIWAAILLFAMLQNTYAQPDAIPDIWTASALGESAGIIPRYWTAPVISGPRVIVGLTGFQFSPDLFKPHYSYLYAYKRETGEISWGFSSVDRPFDIAEGGNGEVYLLDSSNFSILSAETGSTLWISPRQFSRERVGNIAIGNFGMVYFSTATNVVCVHVPNRRLHYSLDFSPTPVFWITVGPQNLLFVLLANRIVALNAAQGTQVWEKALKLNSNPVQPFFNSAGQLITVSSDPSSLGNARMTTFDPESGREISTHQVPRPEPPVVIDENDTVYFLHRSETNQLVAFDLPNNEQKWAVPVQAQDNSSGPILLSNSSLFWNAGPDLFVFEAQSGKIMAAGFATNSSGDPWRAENATPSANIDEEGYLYVFTGRRLRKFGPIGVLSESSWPKEDRDAQNTAHARESLPTPQIIYVATEGNSTMALGLRVKSDRRYILESSQLDGNGWVADTSAISSNAFLSFRVPKVPSRRFFRVKEE
jgi:outer membrane protein assembly factor BamB